MAKKNLLGFILCFFIINSIHAQVEKGWYTEGNDFAPSKRIRITVVNPMNIPLKNQPVTILRSQLPVQNIPERSVSIVDPKLPENPKRTREQLKKGSGYLRREETNGHSITLQLDDVDQDGVWDQIFFLTDLNPHEKREFYIYIGFFERGMYEHQVHANIANYGRHTVPLWESKIMGWKLWYPHSLDLHGKRKPMLTAYYEYSKNRSGYYMPFKMGTDIMTVARTFGAGGMCLFEDADDPENLARATYSPYRGMGPYKDTRYSYDVVFNGPLRSMIKVTTTNWNSALGGFYELKQYYTVIAHKSWTTCKVKFTKFLPPSGSIMFGAGIRHIMAEYKSIHDGGIIISMAKNYEARIPDEDIGDEALTVPWEGIALVVKDKYKPKYININSYGGNHLFKMPVTPNKAFEYMALGGWSFGNINNNEKEFVNYVKTEAQKYNHPPILKIHKLEIKN